MGPDRVALPSPELQEHHKLANQSEFHQQGGVDHGATMVGRGCASIAQYTACLICDLSPCRRRSRLNFLVDHAIWCYRCDTMLDRSYEHIWCDYLYGESERERGEKWTNGPNMSGYALHLHHRAG